MECVDAEVRSMYESIPNNQEELFKFVTDVLTLRLLSKKNINFKSV